MTKLHVDMSDAVNIMAHAVFSEPESPGTPRLGLRVPSADWDKAGAVWDIYRREDVPALERFLKRHAGERRRI